MLLRLMVLGMAAGCISNRVTPTPANPDCVGADCDSGASGVDTDGEVELDVQRVTISPGSNVYNTDVLTCEATAAGPAGASITVDYAWMNVTRSEALGASADLALNADLAGPGDVIRCTASADDGTSGVFRSATVTLGNRAPEVHSVEVSAATAAPGDTLSCLVDASDPDDDALTIEVQWSNGATGIDQLVTAATTAGDVLHCTATVSDPSGGEAEGSSSSGALIFGAAAYAEVSPTSLTLPNLPIDCTATSGEVTVSNTSSSAPLTVYNVQVDGADGEAFSVGLPTLPTSVAPGTDLTFTVSFTPSEARVFDAAYLRIVTDDPSVATLHVPLTGTGLPDTVTEDQFAQGPYRPFDVLTVIDNSGSMGMHQAAFSAAIESFVTGTDAVGDWRFAVTTTDTEGDTQVNASPVRNGLFVGPWVQSSDAQRGTAVGQQTAVGTGGSSVETGLEAAWLAVSEPMVNSAPNQGFLRSSARLVVLIVSDEDDDSADPVASYAIAMQGLKWEYEDVFFAALTGPESCPPASICVDDAGQDTYVNPAPRYHDAVQRTGGVWANLGQPPFDDFFAEVWRRGRTAVDYFLLEYAASDASAVEVRVDGALVPMSAANGFTVSGDVVRFHGDAVPEPGEQVAVTYPYRDACP